MTVFEAHKGRFTNNGLMDFSHNPRQSLIDGINTVIDQAIVAKYKEEYDKGRGSGIGDVAKKRIGSSYIGTACDRELAFRYHKYPKEDRESVVSPGELNRHAQAGHWTEEKTAEWMRWAGFDLRTNKADGSQYGYKVARDPKTGQFRIAGEIDGVILGVPEKLQGKIKTPCLWESKKATDKKWKKFNDDGVAKADPEYYGQVQTNMAYLAVDQTLFSMLNLDTMKYHWELIPLDTSVAQKLSDRAVRVLQSQSPADLARITRDPNDFRCRFCDYHKQCWGL